MDHEKLNRLYSDPLGSVITSAFPIADDGPWQLPGGFFILRIPDGRTPQKTDS